MSVFSKGQKSINELMKFRTDELAMIAGDYANRLTVEHVLHKEVICTNAQRRTRQRLRCLAALTEFVV